MPLPLQLQLQLQRLSLALSFALALALLPSLPVAASLQSALSTLILVAPLPRNAGRGC